MDQNETAEEFNQQIEVTGINTGTVNSSEKSHVDYPDTEDPPSTPQESANREEWKKYFNMMEKYVKTWCKKYDDCGERSGIAIWCDFTCDFTEQMIMNLNSVQATMIRKLLMSRGVNVLCKRGFAVKKAILNCWEEENCPITDEKLRADTQDGNLESNADDTAIIAAEVAVEAPEKEKSISNAVEANFRDIKDRREYMKDMKTKEASTKLRNTQDTSSTDAAFARSSGMQGLIKAFGFRQRYSGQWDEDIVGVIEVYELAAEMCNVTEEEKLKGVPIMLNGSALSYYGSSVKGKANTYKEAINLLLSWFTSDEQRSRLLQEWHETRLTKWFHKNPEKSQLAVFREMSARLGKVQRQLDNRYREDIFLRDQLITAADIDEVKRVLKIQLPATAHDANQKIASLLSSELGSASQFRNSHTEGSAFFGIGQKYHGQAQRRIPGYSRDGRNKTRTRNKLSRVKGCWVCGKDHLANKFHSRTDVENALNRLKSQNVYVAVEDVINVFTTDDQHAALSSNEFFEADEDSDSSDQLNSGLLATEINDLNVQLEANLSNKAFIHSCGFNIQHRKNIKNMEFALTNTDRHCEFNGIIIDTGANRLSLMSLNQYRAYCRQFDVVADIKKCERHIFGLGSKHKSIGTATISIPFHEFGIICDVDFYILQEDCKSLLSRRDLKNTGLDLSVQRDCLHYNGVDRPLSVENDLLVYHWNPGTALLTYEELKKLHRSFGHPSVNALHNLLKRARRRVREDSNGEVRDAIVDLTEKCKTCCELSSKPKRFKLTVGTEDGRFNNVVAADIMYIDSKPVLHVVDEATHFAAASFLQNISANMVWKTLLRIWSHVYMGPPDHLRLDQGSQFISDEFKGAASTAGIELIYSPIENPSSMTHVERYHAPLRNAYKKLQLDLPNENSNDLLQMAVHAVNSTVGPEGLCPTLCVFGAIPKPARILPAPKQIERAKAIDDAIDAVECEQAKRKLSFAAKYRGPYGKESTALSRLQFGAPVRVYRQKSKKWEGPFKFVFLDGETVVVQMPSGRKIFRSHSVKPDKSVTCDDTATALPGEVTNLCNEHHDIQNLCEMFDEPPESQLCLVTSTDSANKFAHSRRKEIQGLLKQGVFKTVKKCEVPVGTRIYGTRWVDTMKKNEDGTLIEKSRLVAQNYRDLQSCGVATKSPTVSRFGQRLALCIAAMYPENNPYTRDVTQAYIQSRDTLKRTVYLRPPIEMGLSSDEVLVAVKPLYGIPESGLYWFTTYRDHHVQKLQMKVCKADNCILYRHLHGSNGEIIPGITILQVDDSFGIGNQSFLEEEEKESSAFQTKPRKCLLPGSTTEFNGANILREQSGSYLLQQVDKLSKLRTPENNAEAVSMRAKVQYVATTCRPDITSCTQQLTAGIARSLPPSEDFLKKIIKHCRNTAEEGLRYKYLDRSSLRLVLFTDSSFGNNSDLSSQAGFVIVLMDGNNVANIVHYGSKKCKRVTRSVMAAEVLAFVQGYDEAYIVKTTLDEVLGKCIPLDAYVDSRTTFNCVAKNAKSLEKRLQIDVAALREAHMAKELRVIGWIPGNENPADGLTRYEILSSKHPLKVLMRENYIKLNATGWADMD